MYKAAGWRPAKSRISSASEQSWLVSDGRVDVNGRSSRRGDGRNELVKVWGKANEYQLEVVGMLH